MDKFENEVANADIYNKLDLDINTDPNYMRYFRNICKLLRVNIF